MRFLLLFLCSICSAYEWHVYTPGSRFQAAMTNSSVSNGDIVWVHEGTYTGLFTTTIKSTASNSPIVVRNFNRQRVVIDGQLFVGFGSTNVWFSGLEFIDSNKMIRPSPFNTITGGGRGTKFINCLIHDCCIGLAGGGSSGAQEAYGNVIWNCGRGSLEHAIYWQNEWDEPRTIENNLIGYSGGFGIHCYGASGQLKNLDIIANSVWNSSDKSAILIGGSQPVINAEILNNQVWQQGGRGIQLGFSGGIQNSNALLYGNYVAAPFCIEVVSKFDYLTITNNIISDSYAASVFTSQSEVPFSGVADWDRNEYHDLGGQIWNTYFWYSNSAAYLTFEDWKRITGYDANSTLSVNVFASNSVFVQPNKYEPRRANIVIWNWTGERAASVDVSGVLEKGDTYEVRFAQNWFHGPIMTGRFDGREISIPLTNLPASAPHLYGQSWPTNWVDNTVLLGFILTGTRSQLRFERMLVDKINVLTQ